MAKMERVLNDALDSIEDFANLYDMDTEDKVIRYNLIGLQAGLGLATILQHRGLGFWLKIVFNSVIVRYRHKNLIKL